MVLTKVILEYSDGTIKYIEGEDAIKWNIFNGQVALAAMIHNMNPPWEQLKWKEVKIVEHEQKNKEEDNRSENTSKKD